MGAVHASDAATLFVTHPDSYVPADIESIVSADLDSYAGAHVRADPGALDLNSDPGSNARADPGALLSADGVPQPGAVVRPDAAAECAPDASALGPPDAATDCVAHTSALGTTNPSTLGPADTAIAIVAADAPVWHSFCVDPRHKCKCAAGPSRHRLWFQPESGRHRCIRGRHRGLVFRRARCDGF